MGENLATSLARELAIALLLDNLRLRHLGLLILLLYKLLDGPSMHFLLA